ncbi:hypothetical protein [Amycolatopsis samaneae]|uniref:Integral membrane protein n=1 Tax=Amycolatopsis samaneae TaxID=664691 RepID=A0ABW5GPS1_9PSEU
MDKHRPDRPPVLTWMRYLGIGCALWAVLSLFVDFSGAPVLEPDPDTSFADSEDFRAFVFMLVVAIVTVQAIAWIWLVFLAHRGRNWARVALTVFAAFWLALIGWSIAEPVGPGEQRWTVTDLVQLVLVLATVSTLYTRSANRFFRPRVPSAGQA